MAMHKQMVSLTRPQIDFLKTEADRLGLSVSDLIRRIVDAHREGNKTKRAALQGDPFLTPKS